MPNHCTNLLSIEGNEDDVRSIYEGCFNHEAGPDFPVIDFERIMPVPTDLMITKGTETNFGYAVAAGRDLGFVLEAAKRRGYPANTQGNAIDFLLREYPGAIELGHRALLNERYYGVRDWHDWSVQYWGTKWNAYHHREPSIQCAGTQIRHRFDTAWAPPLGVIAEISREYPEVVIFLQYADEAPMFFGQAMFQHGQLEVDDIHDGDEIHDEHREFLRPLIGDRVDEVLDGEFVD